MDIFRLPPCPDTVTPTSRLKHTGGYVNLSNTSNVLNIDGGCEYYDYEYHQDRYDLLEKYRKDELS